MKRIILALAFVLFAAPAWADCTLSVTLATNGPGDAAANTATLNAAIAGLPAAPFGGSICITTTGRAYWNGIAAPDRPVHIKGVSATATELKSNLDGPLFPFTDANGARSTVERLSLSGADVPGSVPNQVYFHIGTSFISIRDVIMNGAGKHCILITRSIFFSAEKFECGNSRNSGIRVAEVEPGTITRSRFVQGYVGGGMGHAVEYVSGGVGDEWEFCTFTGNSGYAFVIQGGPQPPSGGQRIVVRRTYAEGNAGDAYLDSGTKNNRLRFQSMQGSSQDYGQGNSVGYE